ncbi:hypothetical protein R70006_04956 [Paraburkholderia domus]|uniref:hypothetical protein n=1 Tax=Paraburkholderia domus TaxID=2793075 RepID=UPI001913510F|nr:hypothetical protein [Paraburkholderia domus]MBK5051808.1 hypothetical protein [Burkholderia sp. R-70006]CAE6793416.1 hypothetical protein R70006_04956 [Paraburkholderia domus]
MLGLNAQDAQGLMEDVALMQATRGGSSVSAADLYDAAAALRKKNREIQVRGNSLRDLQAKFNGLGEDYSDLSAVVHAQRQVIDALSDQLAAKLGVDPQDVRKAAYKGLTQRYDAKVGEMLSIGVLSKDPRKDPEVLSRPSRDWYTPEI